MLMMITEIHAGTTLTIKKGKGVIPLRKLRLREVPLEGAAAAAAAAAAKAWTATRAVLLIMSGTGSGIVTTITTIGIVTSVRESLRYQEKDRWFGLTVIALAVEMTIIYLWNTGADTYSHFAYKRTLAMLDRLEQLLTHIHKHHSIANEEAKFKCRFLKNLN